MLEDQDFELLEETSINENIVDDEEITQDDFELVQIDEKVHEQKMQTKPTTFFKDSLKRFRKNKSSVVAAYVLGTLLLMSFLVPIIDRNDTVKNHKQETYLAPKLFDAGTGFWDGTIKLNNIAVDISEMPDAVTEEDKQAHWWPSSQYPHETGAVKNKKFTDIQYCNDISALGTFGKEGYVQFGYYNTTKKDKEIDFSSKVIDQLTINNDLTLTMFDVYDLAKIKMKEGKDFENPLNYELGECALFFNHSVQNEHGLYFTDSIKLVDYSVTHNIGSAVSPSEPALNIAEIITNQAGKNEFKDAYFSVRMIAKGNDENVCSLIGGITFESLSPDEKTRQKFTDMSFTDATFCVTQNKKNGGYKYWSSTGIRKIFLSKAYFCSFTYDTYLATYGVKEVDPISIYTLLDYEKNGWLSFKNSMGLPSLFEDEDEGEFYLDTVDFKCTILNKEKCPVVEDITIDNFFYTTVDGDGYAHGTITASAKVQYYKYLGYSSMPRFLMGTDINGKDMFKYVFEGLRTSLLLGFLTFIVCFLFGLVWGSICGYFGGTVDLVMERFTDILAGVPWIVMMTLIIQHLGQNFWTFAIALCMTGWIGTAARTRTQFYRFRGREYVLASRTLGASDARLISKHILPNALGTIITGAVLMIPSVIFSEATISYLGLGLQGTSSLGVILSSNQGELIVNPYLLIFPAIVIALIMISFNLFGNGLRDAINPSLKGED